MGFRGSQIQKSVEAVKRLDRLAPNLAHMIVQIHLGMDIRQTNCHLRHLGVLGGQTFKKSGEAVKRLDRLAPTLVHVCGFIWELTQAKYKLTHNTPGGILGVFRGHKFKCLGKLSKCSTDWHQIRYTFVDSSGNVPRLKTIHPTAAFFGGFRGNNSKAWEMWSNGWTEWE